MWADNVGNSKYLHSLYKDVPLLKDVEIKSIDITGGGHRVRFIFDMPRHADFPPPKWGECNVTAVILDFVGVTKLSLDSITNPYRGDIELIKNSEGYLEMSVKGTLNLAIVAGACQVQQVRGYSKWNIPDDHKL